MYQKEERVCIECYEPLTGSSRQKRCPECQNKRTAEKIRDANRRIRRTRTPKAGEEVPEHAKLYRYEDGTGRWQWREGKNLRCSLPEFGAGGKRNVIEKNGRRYVADHVAPRSERTNNSLSDWEYLFGWHQGWLVISLDTLNDNELFTKLGAYYRTEDWPVRNSPSLKLAGDMIKQALSQPYSNDSYVVPSKRYEPRWNGYSYN